MQTWGMKSLENDDALDWLAELEESSGTELLDESLEPEEIEGYHFEAPDAARIICAAC